MMRYWWWLASLLRLGSVWAQVTPTMFPPEHLSMWSRANRTASSAILGDAPARINRGCACAVTRSGTGDMQFYANVVQFTCARPCEWKLKIYVDGCLRFSICCETTWEQSQGFLLSNRNFKPNTRIYISHENFVPDDNGSLLKITVVGYSALLSHGTTSNPQHLNLNFACGDDPAMLPTLSQEDCFTTTPASTTSDIILSSISPSANTTGVDGGDDDNGDRVDGDATTSEPLTKTQLMIVIGVVVAVVVLIFLLIIGIAICECRKVKKKKTRSERLEVELRSTYSYTRALPGNDEIKKHTSRSKHKAPAIHNAPIIHNAPGGDDDDDGGDNFDPLYSGTKIYPPSSNMSMTGKVMNWETAAHPVSIAPSEPTAAERIEAIYSKPSKKSKRASNDSNGVAYAYYNKVIDEHFDFDDSPSEYFGHI